MIGTCLFN